MNLRHANPCTRFFNSFSQLPSSPSTTTNHHHHISILLSSCRNLTSLYRIHAHLITSGHTLNPSTTTHLMNLYSSFQKSNLSRKIFDSTPKTDVILYNTMIKAYIKANNCKNALQLYHSMLEKSILCDKYTFTFSLKACTSLLNIKEGNLVHKEIIRRNLEGDVYIATGLIDMYSKTGDLESAKRMFDKITVKDVTAWNAMISGLSKSEEPNEALELFKCMQIKHGVEPNAVSLLNLLPAVGKLMDMKACRCIHGYVFRRDFKVAVTNGLIDMYSKCGYSDMARKIFDQMRRRDDVSWGTMMSGYAYNGEYFKVLELFDCIKRCYIKLDKVSSVSALLAAGEVMDFEKGVEIHNYAIRQKMDSDIMIATSLLTMYAKFSDLEKVKEIFKRMHERDLVAWSAIISAFAQSGYPKEALCLFRDMLNEHWKPNVVTLVSILPACGDLSSAKQGKSLHCYAIKASMHSDISVETALISMYAKCNLFNSALLLFNNMSFKEVVTWNTLINGYAQIGDPYNVMEMYNRLKLSGVHPDSGTMVGVLPACALLGDKVKGSSVHGQTIKYGFDSDYHVKNALIDMYAKCKSLGTAELLFSETESCKDEILWNTMITGYMVNDRAKEAISVFYRMKLEHLWPNLVTIISILPAVTALTDLKQGMSIHSYVIKTGFESFTAVSNSLIDMYSKCGRLDYSEHVFDEMKVRDIVSWNSILAAYSIHGHGDLALEVFTRMQENEVGIDFVSYTNVLSACRHVGLIDQGREIFCSMKIQPNLEHYACMVDLLGRAGLFDEILELIDRMCMKPDAKVWGAVLSACTMHSNVKLGEVALEHLKGLESENPASYVVLSTIYSQSGRWVDARNTRIDMKKCGLRKNPGCSWV